MVGHRLGKWHTMAFEVRHGNKRYFYRSRRINGRHRKEYVGGGWVGALASDMLVAAQAKRRREQGERRSRMDQLLAIERQLADLDRQLDLHVFALLVARGFYLHRRSEWRRRNGHDGGC
jgi:hypothetical protein